MKKFEYFGHTADAKFRAYGKTLEEAFINSALAMYNIICDSDKVLLNEIKKIKISAKRKESLLYDFLEEFLFLLDTGGFLLNKIENFKIKKIRGEFHLSCEAFGDNYKKYDVKGNIKSITYNEMFIREKEDKVIIQVVVDM
jgi:SHS2 domain-containing protein